MAFKTTPSPSVTDDEYNARFEQEVAAYAAMHPQLLEKYAGKWVAVHGGQVVDIDVDDVALFDRVIDRYGEDTPIFLHKVTQDVFEVVDIPGSTVWTSPSARATSVAFVSPCLAERTS
jgi:hypothetical protein